MPAAQQITLQPTFDRMLAEHLHNTAIRRKFAAIGVFGKIFRKPDFFGDIVERLQLVRLCLVRPKHSEIPHIQPCDLA